MHWICAFMVFDCTLYIKYMIQVHQFLTYGLLNTAANNADDTASDVKIMKNIDLEKSRKEMTVA